MQGNTLTYIEKESQLVSLLMGMGFAINVLNLQLQGCNENIFKAHQNILSDRNHTFVIINKRII